MTGSGKNNKISELFVPIFKGIGRKEIARTGVYLGCSEVFAGNNWEIIFESSFEMTKSNQKQD